METKTYIWLGICIGGSVGGFIGALIDQGNPFGLWGLLLGTVGSFVGIWGGYKLGQG